MDLTQRKKLTRSTIDKLFTKSGSKRGLNAEDSSSFKCESKQNDTNSDIKLPDTLNESKKSNRESRTISQNSENFSFYKKKVKENQIPLKDKFLLSDLERYYKFGIFPYIVFIHFAIVMLTTLIVKHFIY